MSLSLLIVDDHEGVARALAELLRSSGFDPVEVAHSANTALSLARRVRPDVVTIDLDLDGGAGDGLELLRWLRAENPHLATVVLTATSTVDAAVASLRAGARGFIPKASASDDLLDGIRAAARGHTWIPLELTGQVVQRLMEPEPPNDWEQLIATLSAREREVLGLMVEGLSRRDIGTTLSISLNTVRTHIKNILAKLGVHASLEAVSLALRAGVRPDERRLGVSPAAGPRSAALPPREGSGAARGAPSAVGRPGSP